LFRNPPFCASTVSGCRCCRIHRYVATQFLKHIISGSKIIFFCIFALDRNDEKKIQIIYTKQMAMYNIIKWTVSRDFLLQGFYHESSSPMPLKIAFRICSKIRGDILKSGCNTSINNTGGKQWEQYQTAYTLKGTRKKIIFMLLYSPKVSKPNN
jgi:hypothetical protein